MFATKASAIVVNIFNNSMISAYVCVLTKISFPWNGQFRNRKWYMHSSSQEVQMLSLINWLIPDVFIGFDWSIGTT